MLLSSINISPESTSQNLAIKLQSVVFPLPEPPTIAVVLPFRISKFKRLNNFCLSYEKSTSFRFISPLSKLVLVPSEIVGKFLSLAIESKFCIAIPLTFCILPAISKPEKTIKLDTTSITAL